LLDLFKLIVNELLLNVLSVGPEVDPMDQWALLLGHSVQIIKLLELLAALQSQLELLLRH